MRPIEELTDPKALKQVALLLEKENDRLFRRLDLALRENAELKGVEVQHTLALELEKLKAQLEALRKAQFGQSSERRKRDKPDDEPPKEKQTGHGPTEQPALDLRDEVHELPQGHGPCTACGGDLTEWAGQSEDSEEVTVIERRFEIVRHKRKKYRCKCNGMVVTAPGPPKLVPGGRYSVTFAIVVAVAKYLDHLPLDRQRRMMARQGLVVTTQTLWDQIEALARVLAPLYAALADLVRGSPFVHADETTWKLLGRDDSKSWYVWTLSTEEAVYHQIQDGRGAKQAVALFGDFEGIVMTDGYSSYTAFEKMRDAVTLAHCWSHVRRKVLAAEKHFPECVELLDLIDALFLIDRELPSLKGLEGDALDDALATIRQVRDERSRPVVKSIQEWIVGRRTTPGSSLATALRYAGSQWTGLIRFLDEPRVPLSNNLAERALRGAVLGRKNHYGSRSRRGTEVAAILYSLMESAKLCGVDPQAYLEEAVHRLLADPTDVLLPHAYMATAAADAA